METERRVTLGGLEWRAGDVASGPGMLRGVAMRFGAVARLPWGREQFEPGSLEPDPAGVILNRQHDRGRPLARHPDGGLDIAVSPTVVSVRARVADTTDGRDTVALVRAGVMRGLSVEFTPEDEAMVDGVRVIKRAVLHGVAVVDDGAYPDSVVQAMRARKISNRGLIVCPDWW